MAANPEETNTPYFEVIKSHYDEGVEITILTRDPSHRFIAGLKWGLQLANPDSTIHVHLPYNTTKNSRTFFSQPSNPEDDPSSNNQNQPGA